MLCYVMLLLRGVLGGVARRTNWVSNHAHVRLRTPWFNLISSVGRDFYLVFYNVDVAGFRHGALPASVRSTAKVRSTASVRSTDTHLSSTHGIRQGLIRRT